MSGAPPLLSFGQTRSLELKVSMTTNWPHMPQTKGGAFPVAHKAEQTEFVVEVEAPKEPQGRLMCPGADLELLGLPPKFIISHCYSQSFPLVGCGGVGWWGWNGWVGWGGVGWGGVVLWGGVRVAPCLLS